MSFSPEALAERLIQARIHRRQIEPLTTTAPALTLEQAYGISSRVALARVSSGERLVGKKIGLTSKAVQNQLGVHEPDYGYLFSTMEIPHQGTLPAGSLIQGKAEGEVAFVLAKPLSKPEVTFQDVIDATDYVRACIEVIDSRIENWKIKIGDTIADNASSAFFALSPVKVSLKGLSNGEDLRLAGMSLYRNGELESTGVGAACLDHPIRAVVWLAKKMIELGEPLQAGDLILSGAYGPVVPFTPGDRVKVAISGLGEVEINYGA